MPSSPYNPMDLNNRSENEPDTVKTVVPEKYDRCTYCNSKLIFSHDMNHGFLQVIETSRCPGCGVAMNPRKFTLQ